MEKQVAHKMNEILNAAALSFKKGESYGFTECVGRAFWKSFGRYEQSQVMQEVYCQLSDMGFTPLASEQE